MTAPKTLKPGVRLEAVIGAVLAKYRIEAGLKQTDFATGMGLTQSTLSKIERGKSELSMLQWFHCAERLGKTTSALTSYLDRGVAALERSGVEVLRKPSKQHVLIGQAALIELLPRL